jgi:F-type H+-transporting ATPase subunit alpha
MDIIDQIFVIYAVTRGYLDEIELEDIGRWEKEFLAFLDDKKKDVRESLAEDPVLGDEHNQQIREAVEQFNQKFVKSEKSGSEKPS